jgi:hypothetical protein
MLQRLPDLAVYSYKSPRIGPKTDATDFFVARNVALQGEGILQGSKKEAD